MRINVSVEIFFVLIFDCANFIAMCCFELILPGEFRNLHTDCIDSKDAESLMQTISFFCLYFFLTQNIFDSLIYNNILIFYHRNLILQFFLNFFLCLSILICDVGILYQTWTPPIYTSNRFVSLSMQIYHLTFNLRISEVSVNDVAMKNTFSNEWRKK